MRLIDRINLAGVAVAIVGGIIVGAVYVAELKGQIDGLQAQVDRLDPKEIKKAEEQAVERLKKLTKKSTLHSDPFHVWAGKYGEATTEMIGVGEGFCYLTRVTGEFRGGGEAVWIDIQGGSWYLGAKAGNSSGIGVRSICWKWPA